VIRKTTDPSTEDLGGPLWKRVRLLDALTPNGKADCIVTVPQTPADPDNPDLDDEAWWRNTSEKIRNVRNGIPSQADIPAGNIAWIFNYFGRWVVMIPECD
jgi:hypothetical protein